MDEWVQNPTAHTALDDIIPCVDNATAQETLLRTKDTTYQLVNVVHGVIANISNRNFPPQAQPLYYNQSGPLVPNLCNPFNADLTYRKCAPGEVDFNNASQVMSLLIVLFKLLQTVECAFPTWIVVEGNKILKSVACILSKQEWTTPFLELHTDACEEN